MAIEIERKFLVKGDWKDIVKDCTHVDFRQGYLSRHNCTVRVRIRNNKGVLTIKGKSKGISRPEYEYDIPHLEADELMQLCEGAIIEKTRYFVIHEGKTWELDVFKGDNEGLVVAELELRSEDEKIVMPGWAGEDVSSDKRYTNSNLSLNPYKNWKE
jgi:adenylate cyclase